MECSELNLKTIIGIFLLEDITKLDEESREELDMGAYHMNDCELCCQIFLEKLDEELYELDSIEAYRNCDHNIKNLKTIYLH